MSKKNRNIAVPHLPPRGSNKGLYYLGGGLILAGLVVLSVALGQVLSTAAHGFFSLKYPGAVTLELKTSGMFLGVAPATLSAEQASRFTAEVTDEGESPVPVDKIPAGAMVKLGTRTGTPLFRCDIPAAGRYRFVFTADGEGDLFLLHESLGQNRADLAVGVLVCLLLCGFGAYTLWRARAVRKAGNP